MPIYTRTGDDGTTSLYGGRRLSKADLRIEAYGSLDELTSTLGMCVAHISDGAEARFFEHIQKDLYVIMGHLANAPVNLEGLKQEVGQFEKKIDSLTSELPPLTDFIIPGGSLASSWAHMARVSCRSAERVVIHYFQHAKCTNDENSQIVMKYLNRLSDLLFTYARSFNKDKDVISKHL